MTRSARCSASSAPTRRRWRPSSPPASTASTLTCSRCCLCIGAVAHVARRRRRRRSTPSSLGSCPTSGRPPLLGCSTRASTTTLAIVVEDAQWTDGASDALLPAWRSPSGSGRAGRSSCCDGRWTGVHAGRRAARSSGPWTTAQLRELLAAEPRVPLRPDEVRAPRRAGRRAARWCSTRSSASVASGARSMTCPDSLEALVAAEIDVLSAASRGCSCGYASVLGRSFNPLVWRAARSTRTASRSTRLSRQS